MDQQRSDAACSSVPFDPLVGRPDWSAKTRNELERLLWDALQSEMRATERMCRLEDALQAIADAPGSGPGRRIAMQALG
jgi:hypothetical protein